MKIFIDKLYGNHYIRFDLDLFDYFDQYIDQNRKSGKDPIIMINMTKEDCINAINTKLIKKVIE